MGLLSRVARRAGAFMDGASVGLADHMSPLNYAPGRFAPVSNMLGGAAVGAPLGAGGAIATGQDPSVGAVAGAGLGMGAGLGNAALRLGGSALLGGARGLAHAEPGIQLQALKEEALQYVRNSPQATQAVMQAQTPQEIAQIVDAVITRSRSRLTEGGF